jgi:hypothetical protein
MAAALTIAPVRWMPTAIASLADRPASRASLIRVSRKTPLSLDRPNTIAASTR